MAPEIMNHDYYDSKVDVWSIGVMTYYMLSGTLPFKARLKYKLKEMIKDAPVRDRIEDDNMKYASTEAKDFLYKCLEKN